MAKAVFIASSHSGYADRPGEVYHFPNKNYLSVVLKTVGDWVVFYEGRRGDGRGYYAVQKVTGVVPDPGDPTHSFAVLDRATELGFETLVPRSRPDGSLYESGLAPRGGNNTSAVRLIADADFAAIVAAGLQADATPDALPRTGPLDAGSTLHDPAAPFDYGPAPFQPDREFVLTSRAFRDACFARQVKRAYRGVCAMSGLALRNGGGRPEVEAAHIVPVEASGPDTVRNGLALSGTIHWMFDKGLLSVDDDHRVLVARDSIADEVADRLLLPGRRLILPADLRERPHPACLDWHRRSRFKG
jgi:putative restriction endonuclease